jgi:hypothetical protein
MGEEDFPLIVDGPLASRGSEEKDFQLIEDSLSFMEF